MLQEMLLTTIWGRGIMVLTVTGIFLRMITILSYKRMKQAAENPGKTKRQWVMLLKKRYESYERFGRIKNVEAFVEHYFSRKGIMGIPLSVWDKSGLFFSAITILTGILGASYFYNEGGAVQRIMGILLLGSLAGTGLLLLHIMSDGREAKRQIVAALTDYLANGTVCREKEENSGIKSKLPTKEEVEALSEAAVTAEEKLVLEEVLEEYFWN
jgi:hypothetical protein